MPQRILSSICIACLVGLIATATVVAAQTAQKAKNVPSLVNPARLAAAKELLNAMGQMKSADREKTATDPAEYLVGLVAQRYIPRAPKKEKKIREILKPIVKKVLIEYRSFLKTLNEQRTRRWAEKFTLQELAEIIEYYRSAMAGKIFDEMIAAMQKIKRTHKFKKSGKSTVDPVRLAAARELINSIEMLTQFKTLSKDTMMAMYRGLQRLSPLKGQPPRPVLSDRLDKFLQDRVPKIMASTTERWAQIFTLQELEETIKFYKSPVGRKMSEEEFAQFRLIMLSSQRYGWTINANITTEAEREFRRLGIIK